MDLLGDTDGPLDIIPPTTQKVNINSTTNDLLDLLGGLDLTTPTIDINNINNTNGNSIMSLTPNLTSVAPPLGLSLGGGIDINFGDDFTNNAITANCVSLIALDKNGLHVVLVPQTSGTADNNRCLRVLMTATNNSLTTMEQYLFQAAVPKSFTLQMLSPSGSILPPGGVITQEMRLTSSAKVRLCWIWEFLSFVLKSKRDVRSIASGR